MGDIFTPILAKIMTGAAVLLLVVGIGMGIYVKTLRHDVAVAQAETQKVEVELATTVTKYRTAQAAATEWATTAKRTQEERDAARKQSADRQLALDLARDRASTARYAGAHSLQAYLTAAGGKGGSADLSKPGAPPQIYNGPGGAAQLDDLVVIGSRDLDLCTVNSRRTQVTHDWGLTR